MKYIRTKDGRIIDLPKQPTLMKYDKIIIDLNEIRKGKVGHEIISALIDKQADTIEELCDEWICRDNRGEEYKPYRFYFLDDLYAFIKENKLFEQYTIYGAIWTDKGLIYVAKMNDKGELELI